MGRTGWMPPTSIIDFLLLLLLSCLHHHAACSSSSNILYRTDMGGAVWGSANRNASDPELFVEKVNALLTNLSSSVTADRALIATGETSYVGLQKIYGLVECERHATSAYCNSCLKGAIGLVPTRCQYREACEGRFLSCRLKFDTMPFSGAKHSSDTSDDFPPSSRRSLRMSDVLNKFYSSYGGSGYSANDYSGYNSGYNSGYSQSYNSRSGSQGGESGNSVNVPAVIFVLLIVVMCMCCRACS